MNKLEQAENKLEQAEREKLESQSGLDEDAIEQADPIGRSIEEIANLHVHMESKVDRHQRSIETITAFLGRPSFLYIILLFVACWILLNISLMLSGIRPVDPPPFTWLELIISISALLMTTVVLITQWRQNRATELRRHLDLQVNVLVEQKVTKLIELVEELRRDLPQIEDRHDPEVEALKQQVNPHEVVSSFNQLIKEAAREEAAQERE
ncbi:MAG: DUF1003 domain-containing protein [Chloroflexi bacterium]|nr:MAG: DUF1003 domain-containing protein [Chloroflexota bacterium]